MSRPAPSSIATSDSEAHMRSDTSSSSSDSDADAPRRIELRRRKRVFRRWLRRRSKYLRRERAENVAERHREQLEVQRRANELARLQEWEDRCHCGGRYSLCTRAQRLARYRRPSEIYVPNPTQPPQRRIVTGIDLTNSDEGVEVELAVKIKGPDQK
jgi:hypothetical protein